ncbi:MULTISPECIES: hypothetical protein [unclassified Chelatococcus]|uniref:hypothetical protein n=1 Tax=unclassified Chelatococcus TaxID=2638111 RepID=UPI001BD0BC02|nr:MULTISPECIES: hypothetical protein [unclassified Chelatococcus]MBS7697877.1 hypothetical protein [Chelatococcus sp. YT9]MBX3558546.1 hypothetical protein [Chelatococcus sp.]
MHRFPMAKAQNQGLANLYYVEEALAQAGIPVRIDRGTTDEGDHWIAVLNEFDDVIAHVAHIDGEFVVASLAFADVVRGRDIKRLLARLLDGLRSFGLARDGLLSNQNVLLATVIAMAALHLPDADAAWWAPLIVNQHSGLPEHIGVVPAITLLHVVEVAHEVADSLGQLFFSDNPARSEPIETLEPRQESSHLPLSPLLPVDVRHEAREVIDVPEAPAAPKTIERQPAAAEAPAPMTASVERQAHEPTKVLAKEAEQSASPAEPVAEKTEAAAPLVTTDSAIVVASRDGVIWSVDEGKAVLQQFQPLDTPLDLDMGGRDITLTLLDADYTQQTLMSFEDGSSLTLVGFSAENPL